MILLKYNVPRKRKKKKRKKNMKKFLTSLISNGFDKAKEKIKRKN